MNQAILTHAFEPSELAFLQRFFHKLCRERGLLQDSVAASELAVKLIELYQKGVRDQNGLEIRLHTPFPIKN